MSGSSAQHYSWQTHQQSSVMCGEHKTGWNYSFSGMQNFYSFTTIHLKVILRFQWSFWVTIDILENVINPFEIINITITLYFLRFTETQTGLIGKHTCGDISAKLYCVVSCMFCETFKVKCPVIGSKSVFSFIWNRWTWICQCFIALIVESQQLNDWLVALKL